MGEEGKKKSKYPAASIAVMKRSGATVAAASVAVASSTAALTAAASYTAALSDSSTDPNSQPAAQVIVC